MFIRPPIRVHQNTDQTSPQYTTVLDFPLPPAFSNAAAICACTVEKNRQDFAFLPPKYFRGFFHEISIAKVLLKLKPQV